MPPDQHLQRVTRITATPATSEVQTGILAAVIGVEGESEHPLPPATAVPATAGGGTPRTGRLSRLLSPLAACTGRTPRSQRGPRAMQVQAAPGWAACCGPPCGNRYLESPEVETGAGLAVPLSAAFAAGFSAAFSPLLSPLFSPALLSPLAGLPLLCA